MLAGSERRFRPIKALCILEITSYLNGGPQTQTSRSRGAPTTRRSRGPDGRRGQPRSTGIYRAADGAGGLTGSRADLRAEREEGPGNVTCRSAIVRFI